MRKFIVPKPQVGNLCPPENRDAVAILPVSGMTPDKIRQAKSKQALLASGGKRVSVNLSGQAVADLEAISARYGTDGSHSIAAALRHFAPR